MHSQWRHKALCLSFVLLSSGVLAQGDYRAPRTEYGHPDLQGVWTNAANTSLQRSEELGNKRSYTLAEAMELENGARQQEYENSLPLEADREAPEAGGRIGQEADFNFVGTRTTIAQYDGEYRTSLIVKPDNGRWPFVEDYRSKDHWGQHAARGLDSYDGIEGRPSGERCLDRGLLTSIVRRVPYNANYQFVQNENYVVILAELIHDARIIRLDSEYIPGDYNHWHGDSIGHWEGDTLVVETRNFRPEQSSGFIRMTDAMKTTEWFTRVSDDTIQYAYELEDPNIYTETVRVEIPLKLRPAEDRIYEYACHEGNYSQAYILAGARQQDVDASQKGND